MSLKLKIKAYSLAEEAKYIRKCEQKLARYIKHLDINNLPLEDRANAVLVEACKKELRLAKAEHWSIQDHRKRDIRIESRATHLARMYLRGRSYRSAESKTHSPIQEDKALMNRIATLVWKYSSGWGKQYPPETLTNILLWIEAPPIDQTMGKTQLTTVK